MSNAGENASNFPTMIIPQGTEIKLNDQGQLSIKTPGNLVIQNSGNYSELESTNGSIRIEENVKVDAVSVRAGEACYIQGTLTAWKVKAGKIALEDRARAYIMLQESDQLELSKTSRLVGNFANEREIYLMLGKFNQQLKQLPAKVGMEMNEEEAAPRAQSLASPEGVGATPVDVEESDSGGTQEVLAGPLLQALTLIDDELRRSDIDPSSGAALQEVVYSLREKDLQRAKLVYRDAFSELTVPSARLQQAYELLDTFFAR